MTIELEIDELKPFNSESPASYAERLGIYYSGKVNAEHKKDNGQFFTPLQIANFMASLNDKKKGKVKILDPGCGVGILSAALCEALANNPKISSIELVAFETDIEILPIADLSFKFIAKWLKVRGVEFTFFLCKNDFILHNSRVLTDEKQSDYDYIISNPPYFKLSKGDERITAARSVIYGQTNIYSIFLLIATKLLGKDGQLIFIVPRSFCSGSYFRLFRELLFSAVKFQTIHLFNSRSETFKRDKVLQENIIITAKLKVSTSIISEPNENIIVSYSNGINDIHNRRIKTYKWNQLVDINSDQKILHLPSSDIDEKILEIFKTWKGSLNKYQFKISTGKVVDFRSLDYIRYVKGKDTVPLIWLHNIESMRIDWPKKNGHRGKPKGHYIRCNDYSINRMVQNQNYVFVRRFSTKENNKRLVAAPYLKENGFTDSMIGIENHLNYIYHKDRELSVEETFGLAAILNSRLFDLYFRTFNGNINVSATELREFPLPSIEKIKWIGETIFQNIVNKLDYDLDHLVSNQFNLTFDLSEIYA